VKNSAKVKLLSFNRNVVFLNDLKHRKVTFLKRDSAVGMFAWVIKSLDCRFELQVK